MSKTKLVATLEDIVAGNEHPYTPETRGILEELYSIIQRQGRSMDLEKKFKSKKGSVKQIEGNIKMPPPAVFSQEDFEKKRTRQSVQPVEPTPEPVKPKNVDPVKPIEVEPKAPSNESELLDIVAAGVDSAKQTYKNPRTFGAKLKSLGVQTDGKTFNEHFEAARQHIAF